MFNIFSSSPLEVVLPPQFDKVRMYQFIKKVVDERKRIKSKSIVFDFGLLNFIDPIGVVALSNIIEYLSKFAKCEVKFKNIDISRAPIKYLDDSGFFIPYHHGRRLSASSPGCRQTTCPLQIIPKKDFTAYLNSKLIPWASSCFNVEEAHLTGLRAAIEEIFHNINDHSGIDVGCTFSQYYPKTGEIHIAVADFGQGIPNAVRKVMPELDDQKAMIEAAKEGFTTKSNVRNRGAGIPTLVRYVKHKEGSALVIASGKTEMTTSFSSQGERPTVRVINDGFFPGTLVRVIITERSIRSFISEVEEEDFSW